MEGISPPSPDASGDQCGRWIKKKREFLGSESNNKEKGGRREDSSNSKRELTHGEGGKIYKGGGGKKLLNYRKLLRKEGHKKRVGE